MERQWGNMDSSHIFSFSYDDREYMTVWTKRPSVFIQSSFSLLHITFPTLSSQNGVES